MTVPPSYDDNTLAHHSVFSEKDTLTQPSWFDPWSSMHFGVGLLIAGVVRSVRPNTSFLPSFVVFNIMHGVYEIKDYYTSYTRFFQKQQQNISPAWLIFFSGNSHYNSIGDQIAAALGSLWFFKCDISNCILSPYIQQSYVIYDSD